MNIKNRSQLYFDSFINDNELINEIFNVNPDKYVFRHHDCPIVFVTDGNKLYAMDMDEQGIDPIEKYGYDLSMRSEKIPYYVFVEISNELLK